jgi:DNA-binding LytR/AlgR family response regulator
VKIKTFIAEDEPNSMERLKELLKEFPELSVEGEAGDGLQAIKSINSQKPDLVFLDIRMPGATGFEVLEKIEANPMVIFVTAYDEYAIKAFEENAVDYILKPTAKDRLSKAVKRVLDLNFRLDHMDLLRLKQAIKRESYLRRFVVKKADEIQIFAEDEVYYFNAQDKYVFLHTQDKQFFYDLPLKELEEKLDPDNFCRIHRSHIVSLGKILRIKKWFHSEYIVELKDDARATLKVSRNYKAALQDKLQF